MQKTKFLRTFWLSLIKTTTKISSRLKLYTPANFRELSEKIIDHKNLHKIFVVGLVVGYVMLLISKGYMDHEDIKSV